MGDAAPFDIELSEGPTFGRAVWGAAEDGTRLRIGFWVPEDARATILLFPGRTEYLEKYGRVARDLTAAGYAVAAIDWRGQGHSDRLIEDARLGYVMTFSDYQQDVDALAAAVDREGLPGPRYLIAHSMGGCIGLRAMIEGLAIERAVFSAPMWGIWVPNRMRPAAATLPWLAKRLRQELRVVPGTQPTNYVSDTGFEENMLTTDRDHYDYLGRQALAHPAFALGGPTYHWLSEARKEMKALYREPRPKTPVLTFLGTEEEIVHPGAIRRMHEDWPSARLEIVESAKHELMMEAPAIRARFMEEALAFLGG